MNQLGLRMGAVVAGLLCMAVGGRGGELRLGFFPNLTHGQALYAKNTGDFERATGVRIKWIAFSGGPTAIESIFANAVDATYIGPGPTVNGHIKSRGEKFAVVAGAASGGAGLVVRRGAGINSERDFHGRTIGTPQLGNSQDIAARHWFSERGYKFKEKGGDLGLVPLTSADQLLMFQKEQVDGAWTIEPWLSRLEIEAKGELLVHEGTLWPSGRYVTTHLIVSKATLQQRPGLVKKLVAAHVAATKKLNGDKKEAARILNQQLKEETGKELAEAVMARALGRVEFTWDPLAETLQQGAEWAHQVGFLRAPPQLNGLHALHILNEVLREEGEAPVGRE